MHRVVRNSCMLLALMLPSNVPPVLSFFPLLSIPLSLTYVNCRYILLFSSPGGSLSFSSFSSSFLSLLDIHMKCVYIKFFSFFSALFLFLSPFLHYRLQTRLQYREEEEEEGGGGGGGLQTTHLTITKGMETCKTLYILFPLFSLIVFIPSLLHSKKSQNHKK